MVKIKDIFKPVSISGCKLKKGNIKIWISKARINPLPTSTKLSNKFFINDSFY